MAKRFLLLVATALLIAPLALTAQTGGIQGVVTYEGGDLDGQPAVYVTVFLRPEKEGQSIKDTQTDDEGRFKFSGVSAGTWFARAFEPGYQPVQEVRISLFPNDLKAIELTLAPQERQEETVIVREDAGKLLGYRDTSKKHRIESEEISRLPLINTTVQDLLKLMPGVSTVGGRESTDISVSGGTAGQIRYLLDGTNFTNILSGGPAGGVSSMAIDRFELISGGFQPEYGQAATGIANIITKTGSNEVEFDYALTWRDVDTIGSELDDLTGVQRTWNDLLNANLFPGVQSTLFQGLGGPVSTLSDDNNPTPRYRAQHQIGVGGPIVVDRLFFYTNLDVLSSDFGSPYGPEEFQRDVLTYLAKVTWEVTDANRFWVELNLEQVDESGFTNPQITPDVATEDTSGNWTLAFHDRHAFTGDGFWKDAFLEASFSVNHQYITNRPPSPDADRLVQILMPPAGQIFLGREGPASEIDYNVNDFRLNTSITKPFEKHNIKVGAELGHQTLTGTARRFPIYNDFRLAASAGIAGNALPPSLGQWTDPGPPQSVDESTQIASLYVQDLWTITDRLTLEPGIRVDWQEFVDKILIAPRLGVSLDPAGNGRTQIQMSYGHFYQNLFLNALIFGLRPDQRVSEIFAGPEATFDTVGFDVIEIDDLVEASRQFQDGRRDLATIRPLVTQRFGIDPRLTSPLNEQWTVRVRRLLPQDITVDLSFTEAERANAQTIRTDIVYQDPLGVEPTIQDIFFSTGGREEFQQWTLAVSKNFSDRWLLNASYSQQKILGPITQVADPLDPTRITTTFGVLGRDRTEIINLSASIDLPKQIQMGINFTYQSGLPETPGAFFFDFSQGVTRTNQIFPLGFNSIRLPPERNLDINLSRLFKFGSDNQLETRLTIFNITNEFNVLDGIGTLGSLTDPNPFDTPPLEPGIIPLTVDIPRTVQLEFRLSF